MNTFKIHDKLVFNVLSFNSHLTSSPLLVVKLVIILSRIPLYSTYIRIVKLSTYSSVPTPSSYQSHVSMQVNLAF